MISAIPFICKRPNDSLTSILNELVDNAIVVQPINDLIILVLSISWIISQDSLGLRHGNRNR
jgi:hypothetical protein